MPQHTSQYVPVYRTKKRDDGQYKNISMILVDTPAKFRKMVELWKQSPKIVGFDTETTGLNHTTADLVGCSIAFDRTYSFYLPFGHQITDESPNLSIDHFALVTKLLDKSERVLYWNKKFDKRIRRCNGHTNLRDDHEVDLMIEVYNWDTNVGMPALKPSAKEILGWNLDSFETKFGKDANLSMYRPREVLEYAGFDAVLLLYLYDKIPDIKPRSNLLLKIDEKAASVIADDIEEQETPMDKRELTKLQVQFMADMKALEEAINREAKQKLNPESPKQVREFLIAHKIDTGSTTKKGDSMSCGVDALTKVKNAHPVLEMILKHRKLKKALGTYIKPLQESEHPHFAYKTVQVATGRLSGGTDKKNDFFTHVNIQGVTKSAAMDYFAIQESSPSFAIFQQAQIYPKCFKRNVEGWYFFPVEYRGENKEEAWVKNFRIGRDIWDGYITEGFDPRNNIRRAFVCREGDYYVHFDYAAQEMRLPANFSEDKTMVKMFLSGEDPHKQTAVMLFGEANYNRDARKIAKILNFNLLYGGQKYSIAEKLRTSPEKAQDYIDKWWGLFSGLNRWKDLTIKKAINDGYVRTAFGRVRRVSFWANSTNYAVRAFGERTIINTIVQGTGGDIVRLALIRANALNLTNSIDCRTLSAVHDEINYSVKQERIYEVIPQIQHVMAIRKPEWKVPMEVGLAVGFSWGEMWDFKFTNGVLIPDGKFYGKEN